MTQKRKHLERVIRKQYRQFVQVFVNFRKLQKIKYGKVYKMFII